MRCRRLKREIFRKKQGKGLEMFEKKELSEFNQLLSRERLIQSARITFIDDEEPLLIQELKEAGFSVEHDRTGDNLHNIDNQIYDLAILDYHGVGARLGASQGLGLLKHIRRVSPRTRVLAYTSRSLNASESEFFRLSHSVLPKDQGLGDSLEQVEAELQKAYAKEHLFEALVSKLDMCSPADKEKTRKVLLKSLAKGGEPKFKAHIKKLAGAGAEKAVDVIIAKIFGA